MILGYEEEQQADIDTWTAGMGLAGPANPMPWVEMPVDAGGCRWMPVIDEPGLVMRMPAVLRTE